MACKVAREAGYQYIWIDSCCIDKASSSELSEAIICYAYLPDVPSNDNPHSEESAFRKSR